jgi:hypothetical protein
MFPKDTNSPVLDESFHGDAGAVVAVFKVLTGLHRKDNR